LEDCIIDTSGEQHDEVIENTGRIEFWRRTGNMRMAQSSYCGIGIAARQNSHWRASVSPIAMEGKSYAV
jgi:hypothetical protein